MMAAPVWRGTSVESTDLLSAIQHNCSCSFGMMGIRLSTCESHKMMMEDQRALDGLLYARRYWAAHLPDASKRVIPLEAS